MEHSSSSAAATSKRPGILTAIPVSPVRICNAPGIRGPTLSSVPLAWSLGPNFAPGRSASTCAWFNPTNRPSTETVAVGAATRGRIVSAFGSRSTSCA